MKHIIRSFSLFCHPVLPTGQEEHVYKTNTTRFKSSICQYPSRRHCWCQPNLIGANMPLQNGILLLDQIFDCFGYLGESAERLMDKILLGRLIPMILILITPNAKTSLLGRPEGFHNQLARVRQIFLGYFVITLDSFFLKNSR